MPHWLNYQAFYKVELSEEITLKTWARFFDEKEPVYCAVAIEGEKVSRNSVIAGFERLIDEGYLFTRRGAGTFVASTIPDAIISDMLSAHLK